MKTENEGRKETSLSRRSFLRGSVAAVAVAVPALTLAEVKTSSAADAKPAADKPKAKSLLVFRKNCTGCNSCAYACSLYHEGFVRPAGARLYVRRVKGIVDIPNICWHCADSPCVEACPVTPEKAIYKDKES
ncbi:MAG: twin-arginine translocation signal domain-containing protein, partial [Mailhella sp.]|nr:twin-arginine translocation signal domain-containing protein [Mailhella sp.]